MPSTDRPKLNEIRAFAQRLLARREYAVLELRARLMQKWSAWEDIDDPITAIIDSLQAEGALSDERFAEAFIRSRRQRCQGPAKIHAELRRRQVPEAIIDRQLGQTDEEWAALAVAWLSRQSAVAMDVDARAKYYRRLTNRGFSHQQAMDALSELNRVQAPGHG